MEWYLFAFGSAFFTALLIIIEKKGLLKEHALEFCSVLSIFIFLLSFTFIKFVDFNLGWNTWALIALESLFFSISFLFIAKAIRHMEVSLVSPLLVLLPVFVLFFSFIILKEGVSFLQLLGIFLLIIGIYVLETHKKNFLRPFTEIIKFKYVNYIFLALVLSALSLIIGRYLLSERLVNIYSLTFISSGFFMIYLVALIFILHDGVKGIVHGFKNAGVLIFVVAVFTIVAKLLQNQAILMQKVTLVEIIRRMNVLIVIFLGGELFHEKNLLKKIIATLVMLAGAYLVLI